MRHWLESVTDLSGVETARLATGRDELAAIVGSIETELGDRNKKHLDGRRMTPAEFSDWKQRTKRALKFPKDTLRRANTELWLRRERTAGSLLSQLVGLLTDYDLDDDGKISDLLSLARQALEG